MTWLRTARVVATVCVAFFWIGITAAGSMAEGYSARDDFISSLAGRGSSVAVLGVASILMLAPAHLAGARVLALAHGPRNGAGLLLAAAVATTFIAGFRVSCPSWAAGCGEVPAEVDAADLVHRLAVAAYELAILAAMVAVAARAARKSSAWPRWMAVVSVAAALGSVALLVRTGGDEAGLWQRLWVGTNLGWLLMVTWTGQVRTPAPEGGPPPLR